MGRHLAGALIERLQRRFESISRETKIIGAKNLVVVSGIQSRHCYLLRSIDGQRRISRVQVVVATPSGCSSEDAAVGAGVVPWKGRRHGRRQDRRWATAWSREQIARRL